MKLYYAASLLISFGILLSCNHNSGDKAEVDISNLNLKAPSPPSDLVTANNVGNIGDTDSTGQQQQPDDNDKKKQPSAPQNKMDWDKKIIKTAVLNAEVKDYKSFYASVREKVRSVGGYIAQEEMNQSEYKIENSIVIKVPVDQFDNALTLLGTGTEKINEKKISSEDVTSQVIDTKSRMESKKQVRLRYLDFLKQARNMEEILNVQNEINSIQEEIESAAGRLQYLGHASTFSTINLTYYQVLNVEAKKTDAPPSFGTRVGNAFRIGWNWIGELFIGLISIWPLYLVAFCLYLLYKKIKNQSSVTHPESPK